MRRVCDGCSLCRKAIGIAPWANRRNIVEADSGHPDAWRSQPFCRAIKAWPDRRIAIPIEGSVRARGCKALVFRQADMELSSHDTSKRIVSDYRDVHGRTPPFAGYAPAASRA